MVNRSFVSTSSKQYQGFTLIELLVALTIFALLSVMAYGGLDNVLSARNQIESDATRLKQLQLAMLNIHRDIEQSVVRSIRNEYGDTREAMIVESGGESRIELTRAGYRNPNNRSRSSLQRVAYGIDDEVLYRATWPVLDRAQDTESLRTPLLDGVQDVRVRLLDQHNVWHEFWPPLSSGTGVIPDLPRAVEVTLELQDLGRITRLMVVVQ